MITAVQLESILLDLIRVGGPFAPADTFVGIAESIASNGTDTLITDVERPPGGLATAVAVTTWGTPYRRSDGGWAVDAPAINFRPASAAEATTVANWFIATAATGGDLLMFGPVGPPVLLSDENYELSVVFRLAVDAAGEWDLVMWWNG